MIKSSGNLRTKFHRPLSPPCDCSICNVGIPCRARHVIYDAECKYCHQHYTGVTTRPFKVRYSEHEASIRFRNSKSALSDHLFVNTDDHQACQNPNSTILGYDWKVLDRARSYRDSFIREGVTINSTPPGG